MLKGLILNAIALYYHLKAYYKIWRVRSTLPDDLIYTTANGIQIYVYPGSKTQSPYDFIVKFKQPGKRERTPRHVHLIVELYVKHAYNPALTMDLRNHILNMFAHIKPVTSFPPTLQYFKPEHIDWFRPLDAVGEFSVEFLLVVSELLGIQEKTNYPQGSLTERLYRKFGEQDRFSVIQSAVWRNR